MTPQQLYNSLEPNFRSEAAAMLRELQGHSLLDRGEFAGRLSYYLREGQGAAGITRELTSADCDKLASFFLEQSKKQRAKDADFKLLYAGIASMLEAASIRARLECLELQSTLAC